MKNAAQAFSAGELPASWKALLAVPSSDLKFVARTFVDLQQARHQADYDLSHPFTRAEAIDLIERVEDAVAKWKSIRKAQPGAKSYSVEARVFLAALLIYNQTSRR
jgi:hypothetical protein